MSNAYILLEKEMLDLAHFLTEETNVLTKQETEEKAKELQDKLTKTTKLLDDLHYEFNTDKNMKSDSKREVLDTLEKHINKTDSLFTIIGASLLIAILFVGLGIIVPIVVLLTALFAVIRRFTSFLIVIYREAKYLAYPSERLSDLTVKKQKLVSDLRKIQPKLNDSNHQQRVQLLIDDLQRD